MSRPLSADSAAPRIVAVGDLTADLIVGIPQLPVQPDGFVVSESMQLEAGGSANLLILLARLGARAIALGPLGSDHWGEQVSGILAAEGVDGNWIRREGSTTVALVLVDSQGRHSFIGSYGRGQALRLSEEEKREVARADALFTSGYGLAETRLLQLVLDALECAGREKVPRFFDPGPAFRDLNPELKNHVLDSCEVLLLTEQELEELGRTAEASQPRTVVVKRGSAGCSVHDRVEGSCDVPGIEVPLVDSTAAGDCFDAAYMLACLKGWPAQDCARLGNAAGAAAVQKIGGGGNVPGIEELRAMILLSGWPMEL